MRDEYLSKAFSTWEELSRSKEDILAYESRLKYILDEEGKLDDVKYKAEKKGREEGLKEGKQEIVQNLLSMNIEIEVIQKATGLSVSQLEEIKTRLEAK